MLERSKADAREGATHESGPSTCAFDVSEVRLINVYMHTAHI